MHEASRRKLRGQFLLCTERGEKKQEIFAHEITTMLLTSGALKPLILLTETKKLFNQKKYSYGNKKKSFNC